MVAVSLRVYSVCLSASPYIHTVGSRIHILYTQSYKYTQVYYIILQVYHVVYTRPPPPHIHRASGGYNSYIFCARRSDDQLVDQRRRQRQKKYNSYEERVKQVGDLWNDATARTVVALLSIKNTMPTYRTVYLYINTVYRYM